MKPISKFVSGVAKQVLECLALLIREKEAQQEAVKQAYQDNLESYNRAKATSLQGRGYSVSYQENPGPRFR